MSEILYVEAERLEARQAIAAPLVLAPVARRQGRGFLIEAWIDDDARVYGALQAFTGEGYRRHSGGPMALVEPGTRYLAVGLPSWRSLGDAYQEVAGLLGHAVRGGRGEDGTIIAVGRTAGVVYVEIYTGRDPSSIVDKLLAGYDTVHEEFDPALLEKPARDLARDEWRDPMPEEPNVHVTIETASGFTLGFAGIVEDEFILETHPDMTIYAYPPGQARALVKQLSQIPPSPSAAFHLANTWLGLLEWYGAEDTEIMRAARAYIDKCQEASRG